MTTTAEQFWEVVGNQGNQVLVMDPPVKPIESIQENKTTTTETKCGTTTDDLESMTVEQLQKQKLIQEIRLLQSQVKQETLTTTTTTSIPNSTTMIDVKMEKMARHFQKFQHLLNGSKCILKSGVAVVPLRQ